MLHSVFESLALSVAESSLLILLLLALLSGPLSLRASALILQGAVEEEEEVFTLLVAQALLLLSLALEVALALVLPLEEVEEEEQPYLPLLFSPQAFSPLELLIWPLNLSLELLSSEERLRLLP